MQINFLPLLSRLFRDAKAKATIPMEMKWYRILDICRRHPYYDDRRGNTVLSQNQKKSKDLLSNPSTYCLLKKSVRDRQPNGSSSPGSVKQEQNTESYAFTVGWSVSALSTTTGGSPPSAPETPAAAAGFSGSVAGSAGDLVSGVAV
jgi:hypothetical protein